MTAVALAPTGCLSPPTSNPPIPVVPVSERDRCRGLYAHLAVLRVVDDPQPFRELPRGFEPDEWWVGIDFTVAVEAALPSSYVVPGTGLRPVPMGTFRVHYYTDIDRSVRSGNFTPRDVSRFVRGGRVLALFPLQQSGGITWPFTPVATDADAMRLAERWHKFPVGTPVSEVLSPAEWNDPTRACREGPASSFRDGGLPDR